MTDRRVFTVDLSTVTIDQLRWGDLIDIAEVTDLALEDIGPALTSNRGSKATRLRVVAAFAWIVARRDEPGLAFADVLAGWIETQGTTPSAASTRRAEKRARARMGAALATGLTPDQADQLTVAEVDAAVRLRKVG
jgi:hypothetical protein